MGVPRGTAGSGRAGKARDTAAVTDPQNRESERLGPAPPVAEPGAVRERSFRNLATIDLGPLRRRRDFRLLFIGQGFSFLGSMVTWVAVPFQVYDLTGSSLAVGLLAAAELPPILITAFLGGALADSFDRRRLVQIAELGLASGATLLLVNSLARRAAPLGALRRRGRHGRVRRDPAAAARRARAASRRTGRAPRGERARIAARKRGHDRRAGARRRPHRHRRTAGDLRVRHRHLRVLADDALDDARGAAAARRRAAEHQARQGGDPLRVQPPGADRHLQRRLRRHVLRHADGALPRLRGGVRRARGARAPLRGAGDRLAADRADERLDRARPPARPGGHPRGCDVGRRHGRIRARAEPDRGR